MTFLKTVFRKKDEFAQKLERVIGFYPGQISIYKQAFIHKSIAQNSDIQPFECNERLEFLGDAILDSIISDYLFNKFPKKNEGDLTKLRSRLVSRENLNQLAVKIGLKDFVEANLDKESKSLYGDALEALIGAIYLDKGYLSVKHFIEQNLLKYHVDMDEVINTETDFKSRVLEWCQKEKLAISFKVLEKEEGTIKTYYAELIIANKTEGKGEALTKKKAEQTAAEEFFRKIV